MKSGKFIYLTAFFCGMAVMAVELSATRLLAPYFGTSSIVWTIVIGLIMISLSLGNILGGLWADRYNSMDRLYTLIWLASLWIAAIPLAGKYIIAFVTVVMMWLLPGSLLVSGSTISCMIIFSLPLVVLGMASPYLVKLALKNMESTGRTAGSIYALSTIGSIIGTFIPTFLTIPIIGTNKTFLVFALVLNLICLYYFINSRIKKVRSIISTVLILVLVILPVSNSYAFWEKSVVEDESLYNYLRVTEKDDMVILSTNVAFGVQSVYVKDHRLSGYYYEYGLMAPMFSKGMNFDKNLDILVLGLGTGTFTKQSKYFYPNSTTDGVEIDGKIVDLAKKYFELKDYEANIFVNDGRTFLASSDAKKYDLIHIDAYHDITIPFHMATKEFFSEVKKHLKKNGILMLNINMRAEKNTELEEYLEQTVKFSMKKAFKCNVKDVYNTLVFASDDENCLENFKKNINMIDKSHALYDISRYVDSNLVEITESKKVFTDDLAPVEVLGQKVLDEVVKNELEYYKEQLKGSNNLLEDLFKLLSIS